MKPIVTSVATVCIALGLGFTSGCAVTQRATTSNAATAMLPFTFAAKESESTLAKAGLIKNFRAYWQFHAERKWKERFALEDVPGNLQENFYVKYHFNAWQLTAVHVKDVRALAAEAELTVELTWINPETSLTSKSEHSDMWRYRDGSWKHVVSDPMLNGFKL
jgi:hypothetical protein